MFPSYVHFSVSFFHHQGRQQTLQQTCCKRAVWPQRNGSVCLNCWLVLFWLSGEKLSQSTLLLSGHVLDSLTEALHVDILLQPMFRRITTPSFLNIPSQGFPSQIPSKSRTQLDFLNSEIRIRVKYSYNTNVL